MTQRIYGVDDLEIQIRMVISHLVGEPVVAGEVGKKSGRSLLQYPPFESDRIVSCAKGRSSYMDVWPRLVTFGLYPSNQTIVRIIF